MRITLPPFPVLLQILSSELQQPECISLSLIETVDSPTRTNIRCLYAHMGTITTSASPSISLADSHSVGLRTSFYISATSIRLHNAKCQYPGSAPELHPVLLCSITGDLTVLFILKTSRTSSTEFFLL